MNGTHNTHSHTPAHKMLYQLARKYFVGIFFFSFHNYKRKAQILIILQLCVDDKFTKYTRVT